MTLEDKTLDVEAYKRQREEFLKKRRKLGKKKHNSVLVLGTGALGEGTVRRIVDKQYFGSLDISKVYLVGSSLRRTKGIAKDYQDAGHSVIPGDYSAIADWKDICDVIFIATDHKANRKYKEQKTVPADIREKMTLNNFTLMDDIAGMLNSGQPYNGTILMGTNQVDLLCTYLAQQMDIDPRQIVGLTQIDTLRFRNLLLDNIQQHSEQLLSSPRAAAEFLNNCFVIGAHKGTMVPVVSNIAYANIPADRIEFLKQAIEQTKPKVINRGPEEFEDTGQIASVTPTLAAAEMIEAIITEQRCVTGAAFLDFKELVFTDDESFDVYKGKIPRPVHIGFPVYFKDGKAELLPQWAASEEEREAHMQWFWKLSDEDKLAFIASAADIRGEFDGMLDEGRVKEPVQKSVYCFTRRVDTEADFPAIDLDTVVFSLDSENPARINMYKPGLSLKPRKQFACDLKKLESIQQVCADNKTLAALVLSSNPRTGKDSYKVIRWNLETGDRSEYAATNKPLSSIALQDDDVVCSIHNSKDIAAVYSPDGAVIFRTADENHPMSLIATGDGAMFGISENKIYQIRENQADLITDKIKAELSGLKVLSTAQGSLLVASGYKSNKVYFIDPATSEIATQDSKQGLCAIDADQDGNIYLATIRKDRPCILKYDSIESMMQDPPSSHVKGPEVIKNATSLEFDNDYLFVFDVRDRIYLVDREFPDLEHNKPIKLEKAWTSSSENYAWVKKC